MWGGDYPRELGSFEKLGSNSLTHVAQFCVKNPLDVPPKLDIISSRFSS